MLHSLFATACSLAAAPAAQKARALYAYDTLHASFRDVEEAPHKSSAVHAVYCDCNWSLDCANGFTVQIVSGSGIKNVMQQATVIIASLPMQPWPVAFRGPPGHTTRCCGAAASRPRPPLRCSSYVRATMGWMSVCSVHAARRCCRKTTGGQSRAWPAGDCSMVSAATGVPYHVRSMWLLYRDEVTG